MNPDMLFLIYVGFLAFAACFIFLLLLRHTLAKWGLISRSLGLELLLVKFASQPPSEKTNLQMQQLREKIALMEQLYSHLHVIRDPWWRSFFYGRPYFAMELAVPHIGEEITFYLAISRRLAPAVEKIVQGIFPEAQVERTKDYNIFNPEGVVAASHLLPGSSEYFPIRTYQKIEGDPMKPITNVFTKLSREGEGASFQIVVRPATKHWQRKLKKRARAIFEGKEGEDSLTKTVNVIEELVRAPSAEELQRKKQDQTQHRLLPLEEERMKAFEGKASKPLFEANLRLVASAGNQERAEAILSELEVAFGQFSDQMLNSLKPYRVTGRSLKELVFLFSFRVFDKKRKVVLSSEELTSLFHFPNVPIETPKMKIVKAREAAVPPELPREGILLGFNTYRGVQTPVYMLDDDRRRHFYIIGQTGTGKSTFMENLINQDISAGKGIAVIDPHGDTIEAVLGKIPKERADDVIVFNPGDISRPLGLNILEIDPKQPQQKSFVIDDFYKMLRTIYKDLPEAFGPIFEKFFKNTIMLLLDDYENEIPTIAEISRVFADKAYRDIKLDRETNPEIIRFWRFEAEKMSGEWSLPNMSGYITSKFVPFLTNEYIRPIITQQKSAFNFRDVMDQRKILLVNLSKGLIGELNANLIGMIIVSKLLVAAFSRVDIELEEREDFYCYIDEFQNFTTDSIATILSEARKYRLNLTIAHQFIKQLEEKIKNAVFGNVGSMAIFRVGAEDAEVLKPHFEPTFSPQDLMNIDNFNAYLKLLIRNQTVPPFNMRVYPPSKGEKEVARLIKELSRTKYGRDREDVEREFRERQSVAEEL